MGEQTRRVVESALAQGGSVEEIANEMNLLPSDVLLVAGSRKPGASEEDMGFDISPEQLSALRSHAFALATSADDQAVQAKMTQWLIERRAPTKLAAGGVNFLQINTQIEEARAKMAALTTAYSLPTPT